MFCDEDTRVPLYYDWYNGSLTDRSNLSCALANAKDIGMDHESTGEYNHRKLVLDRNGKGIVTINL